MKTYFDAFEKPIFEFILDHIPDAITVVGVDYKTIFFNKVAESYFDVSREEIIGQDLRDFFPESLLPKVISQEKAYYNIFNKPREHTFTVISAVPIYNNQGELIGGLARDRDITEFVKLTEVLQKTQMTLEELEKEYQTLVQKENFFANIISNDSAFIKTINLCKQVSRSSMNVLIRGESGTGKELFVRAIHHESRRTGKFVALNCSAIPSELLESELFGYEEGAFTGAKKGGKVGLFELAHEGTLFLDEIGDMPLHMQPKLLRVLEEGKFNRIGSQNNRQVNVRIISATHKNLEDLIEKGLFRKDLFYRLNGFYVTLPPLRERQGDIVLLANRFLQQFCMENGMNIIELPDEIIEVLKHHTWDGNVRELRNVMQRVVLLAKENQSGKVVLGYLPDYLQHNTGYEESIDLQNESLESLLEAYEKKMLVQALEKFKGNKKKAAEYLKIPRSNLYYKIEKFKL